MLKSIYPFFVLSWLVLSLLLNEWTASRRRHFSTQLWLDSLIPFMPDFALLYFSAYILGNMGYLILFDSQQFSQVFLGYLLLFVIATLCYILFPCRVDRYEGMVASNWSTHLLSAFQRKSKPYNSFPSMHVGYSIFSALVVLRFGNSNLGGVLLVWAGLVALSTLLTKQHHLLDVIAGAGLAVLVFWGIQHLTPNV